MHPTKKNPMNKNSHVGLFAIQACNINGNLSNYPGQTDTFLTKEINIELVKIISIT